MDYSRQYGEITGPKVGCVGKTDLELELLSYTDWAGSKLEGGKFEWHGDCSQTKKEHTIKRGPWDLVTGSGCQRGWQALCFTRSSAFSKCQKSTSFKMLAQFKRKLRRPNKIGL